MPLCRHGWAGIDHGLAVDIEPARLIENHPDLDGVVGQCGRGEIRARGNGGRAGGGATQEGAAAQGHENFSVFTVAMRGDVRTRPTYKVADPAMKRFFCSASKKFLRGRCAVYRQVRLKYGALP